VHGRGPCIAGEKFKINVKAVYRETIAPRGNRTRPQRCSKRASFVARALHACGGEIQRTASERCTHAHVRHWNLCSLVFQPRKLGFDWLTKPIPILTMNLRIRVGNSLLPHQFRRALRPCLNWQKIWLESVSAHRAISLGEPAGLRQFL
jgi:hypothetical protein